METNLFNYEINKKYIANKPAKKKNSKLLILDKNKKEITHKTFENIENLIKKNDILILNDTYVNSAKIQYKKDSGSIVNIYIEKIITKNESLGFIKSNKKINKKTTIKIEKINITIEKYKSNIYKIYSTNTTIKNIIKKIGIIPIPPYIKQKAKQTSKYQTCYAKKKGSIAAPTAGLHFNKKILHTLKKKGVKICYITLHIGSGTFRTIKSKNINDHKIHSEYIEVTKKTCDIINEAKKNGNKIIACGTTALRALETAALNGKIKKFKGDTNLFIKPGFKFNIVDSLITNFHLPKSTLLVLVASFCDIKTIIRSYQSAIENNYKFYSFGDAMYIH